MYSFIFLFILGRAIFIESKAIYVKEGAVGVPDGSVSNPFPDLHSGIGGSSNGDDVLIMKNISLSAESVIMGKNITIR